METRALANYKTGVDYLQILKWILIFDFRKTQSRFILNFVL